MKLFKVLLAPAAFSHLGLVWSESLAWICVLPKPKPNPNQSKRKKMTPKPTNFQHPNTNSPTPTPQHHKQFLPNSQYSLFFLLSLLLFRAQILVTRPTVPSIESRCGGVMPLSRCGGVMPLFWCGGVKPLCGHLPLPSLLTIHCLLLHGRFSHLGGG